MNEENLEAAPNAEMDATPQVAEDVVDDSSETAEELRARLAKAEELANNYKVRAEKAERKAKAEVATPNSKPASKFSGDISPSDLYVLIENKVPQEDIADVQEYAHMKGISMAEALKSNVVKTILSDKAEMRNTAATANVGTARRSKGQLPADMLIAQAQKGQLPDSDEDLIRLIKARKGIK